MMRLMMEEMKMMEETQQTFATFSTRTGAVGPGPHVADHPDRGGGVEPSWVRVSGSALDTHATLGQPVQQQGGKKQLMKSVTSAATGQSAVYSGVIANHSTADKLLGNTTAGKCDFLERTGKF
jgi:hypothetical protein